ncbi:MAG: DNA-binding MarR family transcriptional regulator [Paracoccaceae bacterium]|jgi:DNA-binding MarR family transcriptional regulator
MQENDPSLFFGVFNEIGIIEQLSRALLEARLPKGLIAPHFAALNHLIRVRDGATPIEMARAFQVPKTSMTHTVSVLAKHGLVDVRPNPNDRRSKCVWLTDAGRALREQAIADLKPEFQVLADGFDTTRLAQILPVLADLRVFLDNHRNAEPPRDRPVPDVANTP